MQETTKPVESETTRKLFKFALLIAVALLAVKGVVSGLTFDRAYAAAGNDDVMRLMSVRDWLAGQSWFDMTQYRLLPEDGLSLHWSRYVDAGIGTIIAAFSLVLPTQIAEQTAAILWPLLLATCLIMFVGYAVRNLFGSAAGAAAIVMVICYPPLAPGYFETAQLDHHNVQILLMTIAVLSLAQASVPARRGMVAALAAAGSLAIGLESLFMVVAVSLLHVTDVAINREGARARLGAYAVTIVAAATLLFVGQTPPADWLLAQCDELAPPMLAVAIIGAASAGAGLIATRRAGGPIVFLSTVGLVTAGGLALAYPLLGPCLQSPYADLPAETQTIIASRIVEALPLTVFFENHQSIALSYFGPAFAVLILTTLMWGYGRWKGGNRAPIGHLIVLGWIGFAAAFWQMRQVVILAAVVPALTGYILGLVIEKRLTARTGRSQLALYGACAVTLFQPLLLIGAESALASSQVSASPGTGAAPMQPAKIGQDSACYDLAGLRKLNSLPAQTILTGTNLGPRLIMATHHAGLSAPYHRSNAALTNGFTLQITDPQSFSDRMGELGSNIVVTCRGSIYGTADSVGSRLAVGATVDGFTFIDLDDPNLMVYQRTGPET